MSSKDAKSGMTGRQFEKEIENSFEAYAKGNVARLGMMPVPTRQVGFHGRHPFLVRSGKAPFDVYGYMLADGRMVGAELKSSGEMNRLPIVAPDSKGNGLQFHQLDALAGLADAGGVARLVWRRDGQPGVLCGDDILIAHRTYVETMKSEASGKAGVDGSKSIPWERFTPVDYTNLHGIVAIDWLLPDEK